MRMICFVEPGDDCGAFITKITPKEAIKRVAHVKAKHPEATNAQLLDYFKVNHWAWEEEERSMDVKIDIKPEAVQEAVVRAIMESALGASLRAAVDKILNEKEAWHAKALVDKVVEEEFRKELSKIANGMIMEKRATIKAQVGVLLTDEAILAFTTKTWDMFLNQTRR